MVLVPPLFLFFSGLFCSGRCDKPSKGRLPDNLFKNSSRDAISGLSLNHLTDSLALIQGI